MTTIKNLVISFVTVLFTVGLGVAAPASASAPGLTVRIVDASAVERELGSCESGFQLRDEANAGSHLVAFRDGEATVTAPIASSMVAPMIHCAGSRRGFPRAGVDVSMR